MASRVLLSGLLICALAASAAAAPLLVVGKPQLTQNEDGSGILRLAPVATPTQGALNEFAYADGKTYWFPSKPAPQEFTAWAKGWVEVGYVEADGKREGAQLARMVRKLEHNELSPLTTEFAAIPATLQKRGNDFLISIGTLQPFEAYLADGVADALAVKEWKNDEKHPIVIERGTLVALWGEKKSTELEQAGALKADSILELVGACVRQSGDGGAVVSELPLPMPLSLKELSSLPPAGRYKVFSSKKWQKGVFQGYTVRVYGDQGLVWDGLLPPDSPAIVSLGGPTKSGERRECHIQFAWERQAPVENFEVTLDGGALPWALVQSEGAEGAPRVASLEYIVPAGGVVRISAAKIADASSAPGNDDGKLGVNTGVSFRLTPAVIRPDLVPVADTSSKDGEDPRRPPTRPADTSK